MARIAGVDLPKDKRIDIGLTYVFGIGRAAALAILKKAGVESTTIPAQAAATMARSSRRRGSKIPGVSTSRICA